MKYRKIKICLFVSIVLPAIFILTTYINIPSQIIIPTDYSYAYRLPYFTSVSMSDNITTQAAQINTYPITKQTQRQLQIQSKYEGNYNLSISLFDCLPLKSVSVSVIPQKYVTLGGETVGVKLYTEGLLVVNTSNVICDNGKVVTPAKDAGVRAGDRILSINGEIIRTSEDFSKLLENSNQTAELELARGDNHFTASVPLEKSSQSGQVKIGLWVRDSTAGIGTITFFDDNYFAALGHAITDVDTGEIMTVHDGAILNCDILSIKKGERGQPGELVGNFTGEELGDILINDSIGIYGRADKLNKNNSQIPIATRSQITTGPAYVAADIDGHGVKHYKAEIQRISKSNKITNKSLVLKITDEKLLSQTGGIVQGMSGAPIIQNNMLVGAITHVFINDPTRGYGIFAENMLYMTENLKKI